MVETKVSVVVRRTGSYEYTEVLIRAFDDPKAAAAFVAQAEREWNAAVAAVPDTLDYPEDAAPESDWTAWERRRVRAWGRFRRLLTCDPKAAPQGAWFSPDEPSYYYATIPFTAKSRGFHG